MIFFLRFIFKMNVIPPNPCNPCLILAQPPLGSTTLRGGKQTPSPPPCIGGWIGIAQEGWIIPHLLYFPNQIQWSVIVPTVYALRLPRSSSRSTSAPTPHSQDPSSGPETPSLPIRLLEFTCVNEVSIEGRGVETGGGGCQPFPGQQPSGPR